MVSTHVNFHIVEALPLCPPGQLPDAAICQAAMLNLVGPAVSPDLLWLQDVLTSPGHAAFSLHERLRLKCSLDAIMAAVFGIGEEDLRYVLWGCDWPAGRIADRDPKGFWRVDKGKHPEHRHTVLTLAAFHDLQEKVAACGGDVAKGIEAFCNQNSGEGWMLPETLRLADYGLGHDDRAKEPQPVRECFGPRFYDWQLDQDVEESWRECHLHARNLLGPEGYARLQAELRGEVPTPAADGRDGVGSEGDGPMQNLMFPESNGIFGDTTRKPVGRRGKERRKKR